MDVFAEQIKDLGVIRVDNVFSIAYGECKSVIIKYRGETRWIEIIQIIDMNGKIQFINPASQKCINNIVAEFRAIVDKQQNLPQLPKQQQHATCWMSPDIDAETLRMINAEYGTAHQMPNSKR